MSSQPETDRHPAPAAGTGTRRSRVSQMLGLGILLALTGCGSREPALSLLVMDPLAKELACPCVGGYAQRDYRALAAFLAAETDRRIQVIFSDDMGKGLRMAGDRAVALIVGKDSVVRHDAKAHGVSLEPWFRLSDRDGKTTQTGMFVVRKEDPAKVLWDVKGRQVFFGPEDSAEKHQAAKAALKSAGVPVPEKVETCPGCGEAAARVVESEAVPAPVGVISSYALPLLEGCGNVPAGSLRVLAETAPVPFVTCFATGTLPPELGKRLRDALEKVSQRPELLKKLESRDGWVKGDLGARELAPAGSGPAPAPSAHAPAVGTKPGEVGDWPDWRGRLRDGRVPGLPDSLPREPRWVWRKPLSGPGLAGLAVAEGLVLVADRDPFDERDAFLAFRETDGELLWQLDYPATGDLDYGRSPRATPVVRDGRVFLLGAFGHLHCVSSRDGKILWKKDLAREFGVTPPKWGFCSTPLWVEGRLIVNPGAREASLVALDPADGRTLWKQPGDGAAYASFIVAELGGRRQVVGYDQVSLGGWDPTTGVRLWRLVPPRSGDFNVPTPLVVRDRLLVVTENNGARLYGFRTNGEIEPEPVARFDGLRSDTVTPVLTGGRVVAWDGRFRVLDATKGLTEVWTCEDSGFGDHASILASDRRVLASTQGGELCLFDVAAESPRLVSRLRITEEGAGGYSHPAWARGRLFVRDDRAVRCLALEQPATNHASLN